MIFESGDRIVFAGDSVTDMGSTNPVGEGLREALGQGYVRRIENLLSAVYPEVMTRVTNSGISGNTSRTLLARWQRDVVDLHPQWVSIMIGINDVWRQFDTPQIGENAVLPDEYEQNLIAMIESVKDSVKGIIIITPFYMEPIRKDPMRARLDEYGAICRKLAEKYGCILVDVQSAFDRYFRYRHSSYIAWDRVHPNQIGAAIIAREFLLRCGFDFNHEP